MGQYGNQPDFGTISQTVVITSDPSDPDNAVSFQPSALYIGTGGTLVCRVVGGNAFNGSALNAWTVFSKIPDGTFFPVIVNAVWANDSGDINTTCSDIIALR